MKDTLSINEVSEVTEFLSDLNDFLVAHEGYDSVRIIAASLTLEDSDKNSLGSFTKWTRDDEIKWEPDFIPDLVGT